jgi:hypothetical protein
MTVISVVEYLSVQAREPSRASLPSSRSDRAEPGSARYSTEPSQARLGSFPALVELYDISNVLLFLVLWMARKVWKTVIQAKIYKKGLQ